MSFLMPGDVSCCGRLPGGPAPMQVVDRERMDMGVAVMLPQVRMIRRQVRVGMCDLLRIVRGPEPGRQDEAEEGHQPEHRQGHGNAGRAPEPARERVGEEPAGMRERELGGEQGRAVLRLGRAPQQASCRGLHRRIADPEQDPCDRARSPN